MPATFKKESPTLRTLTFHSSKRLFEGRDDLLIFKVPKLSKERGENAEKFVALPVLNATMPESLVGQRPLGLSSREY
jgi:hypothetical protein